MGRDRRSRTSIGPWFDVDYCRRAREHRSNSISILIRFGCVSPEIVKLQPIEPEVACLCLGRVYPGPKPRLE